MLARHRALVVEFHLAPIADLLLLRQAADEQEKEIPMMAVAVFILASLIATWLIGTRGGVRR